MHGRRTGPPSVSVGRFSAPVKPRRRRVRQSDRYATPAFRGRRTYASVRRVFHCALHCDWIRDYILRES